MQLKIWNRYIFLMVLSTVLVNDHLQLLIDSPYLNRNSQSDLCNIFDSITKHLLPLIKMFSWDSIVF